MRSMPVHRRRAASLLLAVTAFSPSPSPSSPIGFRRSRRTEWGSFTVAGTIVDEASVSPRGRGRVGEGEGEKRVRVPLGRMLADVLAATADGEDEGVDSEFDTLGPGSGASAPSAQQRRFDVEVANPDGATGQVVLAVEEVTTAAVTGRTTYGFPEGRKFDPGTMGDVAIVASNPNEVEGLTIMSVNKATGRVRGMSRGRTGAAHRIISLDGGVGGGHRELLQMERMPEGEAALADKDWSCGAEHAHDNDDEDGHHHHHHHHQRSMMEEAVEDDRRGLSDKAPGDSEAKGGSWRGGGATTWAEPVGYSFHVDISIDIDATFVEHQGGAEAAVEYINVLISAANVVFEHEVDAHLNVVHIQETDLYDDLATSKDALRAMRLNERPNTISDDDGGSKIILHHAMLGRYLGGGIAFIDSVCDDRWAYGVTSDLAGRLDDMDELVLFDFFIVTHEIGHSLGSGHTFDGYDPPVDSCGVCTDKEEEDMGTVVVEGLPRENSATIMSYCNFCDGGLSNVAITLGGVWDGNEPRVDVRRWENHPEIAGSVSVEPRRVSHNIWQRLNSKGKCVEPPKGLGLSQECNDDGDCDDMQPCSIDACEQNFCVTSRVLENCCGNKKCEPGEGDGECPSDCGPFSIKSPNSCDDSCHSIDGFMISVGLSDGAERRIFTTSVTLAYSPVEDCEDEAIIAVYVTKEGSYISKEKSNDDWEHIGSAFVKWYNPKRGTHYVKIEFDRNVPIEVGERRGFYFAASESVIMFREGVYSETNEHGLELHSSRAVMGLFGNGIDGFGLSCEVSYWLDDGSLPFFSLDESQASRRAPPDLAWPRSSLDVTMSTAPPASSDQPTTKSVQTQRPPSPHGVAVDPRPPSEGLLSPPSSPEDERNNPHFAMQHRGKMQSHAPVSLSGALLGSACRMPILSLILIAHFLIAQ